MLRSTYHSHAKIYNDSDELIPIAWVRAPKGVKAPPHPIKVVSRNWLPADVDWIGLGEYPAKPRKHNFGTLRYARGINCHKRPVVLSIGITQADKVNPIGLNPCCGGPIVLGVGEADGGDLIGPVTLYGGEADAGDFAQVALLYGGEADAGEAAPVPRLYGGEADSSPLTGGEIFTWHPQLGVQFGGRATRVVIVVGDAVQGIELFGDGSRNIQYYENQGFLSGIEFGGTGFEPATWRWYAGGGIELNGDGTKPLEREYRPEGGVELNGSGVGPPHYDCRPQGGVELGGTSEWPMIFRYRASGGVEVGGSADVSGPGVPMACCEETIDVDMWVKIAFTTDPPPGSDAIFQIHYDSVLDEWRGSVVLGEEAITWNVRWWCDGVDAGGMHIELTEPISGWTGETVPDVGNGHCDSLEWLYLGFGGYITPLGKVFLGDITVSRAHP